VTAAAGGAALAARGLGQWLIVSDPLEPAGAVAVLAGDHPFRAWEAALLVREGWAPEVWLQPSHTPARDAALARLGYRPVREEEQNRQLLLRLGVAPGAVRLLDHPVQSTADELRGVAEAARREGRARVIVVTSKAHTRRARATWRRLAGDGARAPRAIVRFAREDPYSGVGWWRDPRDTLTVSREVFALLNAWAGFPVQAPR
jgi:uncharacterized SAM-binding protein YcdF (DUF218 family)